MKLFKRYGGTAVKALSFRSQRNAVVSADKQLAPQVLFQVVHAAGDIGLVVAQGLGGPGEALVLGNIVKNAVIVVRDGQFFHLFAISLRYG